MKAITTIIIVLFFMPLSYAQKEKDLCASWQEQADDIADLDKRMNHNTSYIYKVSDKCKVKVYVDLGIVYLNKLKVDSSLYYIDKAIALGQNINAEEELVLAYTEKCNILISKNEHTQVEDLLKKSRKLLKNYPNSSAWIHYYDKKGYVEYGKSEYYNALEYMDSTIIAAKRSNSFKEINQTYEHKGVLYMRLNEYEKAAENFILSIESKEEHGIFRDLSGTYRYLGSCFFELKQYDTAKKYILKAIEFGETNNNDFALLIGYARLATYNRYMNLNDESEIAVNKAIELAKKTKTDKHISVALEEKGFLYFYNYKDYDQAEKYFEEAYQAAKRTEQLRPVYKTLQSLIALYIEKKDATKLRMYLDELEQIVKETPKPNYKVHLQKVYSNYYEIINQPKKALFYLKSYYSLQDSISNKEVFTKVAALEKQYDTKKKELEIVNLNQEKKEQEQIVQQATLRQRLYLLASIFLLFLLVVGTWTFIKLRKQKTELVNTNQVKNRLFSIIAHDLRGMIIPFQRSGKILKHHIDKGNHERTIELSNEIEKNSESLSNMLDNLLNWSLEQMNGYKMNPEKILIKTQLKEIIKGYEQEAAYKNTKINLKYEEDIAVKLDKGAFHVIFRNLIGNALKYTEDGNIRVEFKKDFNTLLCSVIDTGVGMSEKQLEHLFTIEEEKSTVGTRGEKGTGLGLNLVYRFVKMNNGIIKVSSDKRIGTRFDLSFPISEIFTIEQEDDLESKSA
ncbi:HAMP domain-containing sensor histidine kinase [Aquimarina sp. MMG016]|uniref:tetratricopeptide repeat-containing sensor histidine kinase n=1 Tax=Aquimarina sp. MMG016 TaxID=2822690 RepID=UPI001B3A2D7D|nr:HAMP domain-containing sensor histidine kinase [Aquimarina sp. MMG016]MBQ4821219.1 hypothetical protein [Aquimarina sp. MMG016]